MVAAGPLAAELGEVAGHVAGQVAGDLKATLVKAGVAESEAERWQHQVEREDAILIGAHARHANARDVETLLKRHSTSSVVRTEWQD
jgi:hypothetical protein